MEGDIMVGGNMEETSLTLSQYGSGLLGSMVGDVRQPMQEKYCHIEKQFRARGQHAMGAIPSQRLTWNASLLALTKAQVGLSKCWLQAGSVGVFYCLGTCVWYV